MKQLLNENDQKIESCFLGIIDERQNILSRKINARKVVEYIVKIIYDSNTGKEKLQMLIDENNSNIKSKNLNDFRNKLWTVVVHQLIPDDFSYAVEFVWRECSKEAHLNENSRTISGETTYIDSVVILVKPIVEWYFYDYRKFRKADLKIENELKKYYKNHFTFLDKRNSPYLKYLVLFLSITILGYLFYKYTTLSDQKSEFQKQEIVLPKNDTIVSRPSNTMTVGDSSSNNQQNIGSTVINGGNHTQNGNINETTNGDFHIKK